MLEVKVRCAACAAPRSAPTRPDRAGAAGEEAGETPASMRRTIYDRVITSISPSTLHTL